MIAKIVVELSAKIALCDYIQRYKGKLSWKSLANMSNHTYKLIELTGSSANGIESAVENAISKASESIHNMRWFELEESSGEIEDGKVTHWQVTIKVGFTLD